MAGWKADGHADRGSGEVRPRGAPGPGAAANPPRPPPTRAGRPPKPTQPPAERAPNEPPTRTATPDPDAQTRARRLQTVVETHGIAPLLEALDRRLDNMAGPYRLSDDEKALRAALRRRYGLYQPDTRHQAAFTARWQADRASRAA